MNMCSLEEMECEFSGVGCDRNLRREEQEEHGMQNNHLSLTTAASFKMNLQHQKLQELVHLHKKNNLII